MRKKILTLLKNRIPLFIFLVFFFIFSILSYKQYGITVDERTEYVIGRYFYNKVKGNDKILQEDFVVWKGQLNRDLLDHNHLHHLMQYVATRGKENFDYYHLTNMLFSSLIFIAIYELLLVSTKKPLLALLGPFFLFLTPRFFGDIPSNPKDIPFAIYYFLSIFFIFITPKFDEKLRILILGLSFGLTQSNRIVGYSIYPVYFLFSLYILNKSPSLKKILNMFFEVFIIFLIGFLVHIFSQPYLGADPINHLIHLIQITKQYPWTQNILFFGKEYLSTNEPIMYLPVWISLTTPIFILFFFLISFLIPINNKLKSLISISLGVNLIIFFITKPVIYDGLRHMTYLLPQIVLLSVLGLIYCFDKLKMKKLARAIVIIICSINCIVVLSQYVQLHPYEYIYFNEVIGGLKGAYGKFETDYWGASSKEAFFWLLNNRLRVESSTVKKKIYICGNNFGFEPLFPTNITSTDKWKEADYTICWERFGQNKKANGKEIYSIKREGVPLVHIYEK